MPNRAPAAPAKAASTTGLSDILLVVRGWYRDLMLCKSLGLAAQNSVLHHHRWDELFSLSERLSLPTIYKALEMTQDSIELSEANVNPRLILQHLCLSLADAPRGEGPPAGGGGARG